MSEYIETPGYYPIEFDIEDLETRRRGGGGGRGGGRRISGEIRYNTKGTISNRGEVRKETIFRGAFDFAIDDKERDISFLAGHNFDSILASKKTGTLEFEKGKNALKFRALLPRLEDQTTAMIDAVKNIRSGLFTGISPGFEIRGVPDAIELIEEKGNPGVYIQAVKNAVLYELSVVARPVYKQNTVDVRQEAHKPTDLSRYEEMAIWI